jgi:hypothetical protein
MKCPPGCRVAMTVMSRVKRHVVERKRVQWELEVKCTGATVTVSQSRRRSSVTDLRFKQFEYTLFGGILPLVRVLSRQSRERSGLRAMEQLCVSSFLRKR